MTIVDDPTLQGGLVSSPFDGAGFPTQRTVILQNGKFNQWFHNIVRPSYRDYPTKGPTNLYIEPGRKNQDEIINLVANGAYIVSLKAFKNPCDEVHSTFLGRGFLIKGGKISPYSGKFVITTEINEIFKNVLEIGDDLQFSPWAGAFGSPTLLAERIRMMPII